MRKTFDITERYKMDITAAITNLLNMAEFSSGEGGGAGGTDTIDNVANGQIVGLTTGTYGTRGNGTYDIRQVGPIGRLTF